MKLLLYTFYLQIFTLVVILGLSFYLTTQNANLNRSQQELATQIDQLTTKLNSIQSSLPQQPSTTPQQATKQFINQAISNASPSASSY